MKHVLVFTLAFLAGAAASAGSFQAAAQAASPVKTDPNQPINIAADKFLADSNAKTGTWSGNVMVTQGDIKMRANSMRVNVVGKSNKPDKILANGNVVVDSPSSGTITGDNAVYDVAPRTVTMTGHVVLKRAKDVMRGTELTVNLVTGQAVLGAKGPGAPAGGRVQAVFTPSGQ
jgi:lipopolysaccharide export system protein LptA